MSIATAWIYLLIAGLFEIAWAIGLKYAQGFNKLWPSVFTITTMMASFYFLAQAVKILPIGTSYAIWVGIGAIGVAVFGMIVLQEPASWQKLLFLGLVVVGIIGLKLSS